MSLHASTEWFAKADECLAEAKRLHEGGFHAGACSRAFQAMMFAAKAGLKHGMIEGNLQRKYLTKSIQMG